MPSDKGKAEHMLVWKYGKKRNQKTEELPITKVKRSLLLPSLLFFLAAWGALYFILQLHARRPGTDRRLGPQGRGATVFQLAQSVYQNVCAVPLSYISNNSTHILCLTFIQSQARAMALTLHTIDYTIKA